MAIPTLLCYVHQDKRMVDQLKNHLSLLENNKHITLLDYGDISPGDEREQESAKHLDEAQIILLLISSSFIGSNYCYKTQIQGAIIRHERKDARVIPIILRPVHWNKPPLDKLQPLPKQGKPIIQWKTPDEGFTNVADGIDLVIKQWSTLGFSAGPIAKREVMMVKLNQLIELVKGQMQPPRRAQPTASTLQQLSIFIPTDVVLADLVVGWRALSHSSLQGEEPATAQRRVTCGELADMASQLTEDQGNLAQAIKTWQVWVEAFKNSDDPRQNAMANTFAREVTELQAITP